MTARRVRRQGSADPEIHLQERDAAMDLPALDDRRLGMLPRTGGPVPREH